MKINQYAIWSVFGVGLTLLVIGLISSPRLLLAGKNPNVHLDKSAVNTETPYIVLGMGCFWGAEKRMQALNGVLDVEAGYAGGDISHPKYETLHDTELAIRQGQAIKNHAEVVKVYYDPKLTSLEQVLIQFWENHNPTQGNRQGADLGSNYRSAIYYRNDTERRLAEKTRDVYQANLKAAGVGAAITTEIAELRNYTSAEDYHQDYLEKNPLGYCGLGGMGIAYLDPSLPAKTPNPHASPLTASTAQSAENWRQFNLNPKEQLISFEAEDCGYCRLFHRDILSAWRQPLPIAAANATTPPEGWTLKQELFATPTIVLFRNKQEVARHTGYQGAGKFWKWLEENSRRAG